jgi:hypothetical protein
MARAGGGRWKKSGVYSLGPLVFVGGSNREYRSSSSPGWSHQLGLKV